ncbi:hypothetical protein NDU88_005874 [Pleurodeles waltl]|uniref:Uncharacterized protein n=1 Tax=Pleurodeles waltl TaxID=8319 RepID=A0AAV7SN46_PLEWA|nr:hypothetical protein NDU88_005874 [Pleurodeles waltl]
MVCGSTSKARNSWPNHVGHSAFGCLLAPHVSAKPRQQDMILALSDSADTRSICGLRPVTLSGARVRWGPLIISVILRATHGQHARWTLVLRWQENKPFSCLSPFT